VFGTKDSNAQDAQDQSQEGATPASKRRRPFGRWLAGGTIAAFVVGGVLGVIFWGGFNTVMEYTNTLGFCTSCHVMRDNVFQEYKKTIHYANPAGVRAVCADCHVPKDWTRKLLVKIRASGELYYWLTGAVDTPEKFRAKRLELAEGVWADMTANDSEGCRNCHKTEAFLFDKQKNAADAKRMKDGLDTGGTCIDCHKGIAHTKPDMGSLIDAAQQRLQAAAASVDATSKQLYAIEGKPIFLGPDSASPSGRLLANAELAALDRKADMVKVGIVGWRQEGVSQIIYALPGKRIFVAALDDPAAADKVENGETVTDPDSGQVWRRASLVAWVSNAKMVSHRDDLWAYASQLFYATCASCHRLPNPADFTANQWLGTLKDMRTNANISDEQFRLLQSYVQMHSRDVVSLVNSN
jgi:trimethylamine-N-oxide reductase cytochrome c-type subunit TorC